MKHDRYESPNHNRRDGFGMNLYRNTQRSKIGGVCAGIADHFEINHNVMRILFICALLFTGALVFWLYLIAWIVIAPRGDTPPKVDYEYDENERCYRKRNMFRYRKSAADRTKAAGERLSELANRVGQMERYVTSNRYDLDKQFADLER